jgi:large subunit ribosomal protein L30
MAENQEPKQIRITYVKSSIGYSQRHKATIRTLGLRRLNQSVVHNDTPVVRGMLAKVNHLVKIEEV